MVYHSIQESLEKQGVIFLSIENGLKEYPDLFKEYFSTVVPIQDNKFGALNSAVWSGGSFVYVPKGVKVDLPLQAYFRLNNASIGQFERSLIIADEGAQVHYVEGCTAPLYRDESLHSGVIEIVVKKDARVRYTTIKTGPPTWTQPGNPTRQCFRRRNDGVGGRQPGQQGDHEVPQL